MSFNGWYGRKNTAESHVFQRHTVLSLGAVFWIIVSKIVRSLPVELDDFFGRMGLPVPTKSAFSMKRALITSEFFRSMNDLLINTFYSYDSVKTWKGHVLLACDGTRLALPDIDELGEEFGYYHTYQGENLYPSAKGSIFHDPLNNITVSAEIEHKNKDERYIFQDTFARANELVGRKTVMILDRGYFSYLMMFRIIRSGQLFVMKSRDMKWTEDFISSGKKEADIKICPSRDTSIYRERDWRMRKNKTLDVRVVRFDHPNGSVSVLITNIGKDTAKAKEIIELYRLRWQAETAYGVYKNDMALELFSTFRVDGVRQDFFAALILFNLAALLAWENKSKAKNRKPNMNIAVGLVHNLCSTFAFKSKAQIERRIRQISSILFASLTYIVPDRSFSRKRRKRKTSGKFFRHTNFSMAV